MNLSCPICGAEVSLPSDDRPLFGVAIVCPRCKGSLYAHSDLESPLSIEPADVHAVFGYEAVSMDHPRCPWCGKINYCVIFPEKGPDVAWYANREQENQKANFVITAQCVHCGKRFVIEWDGWPFPIERVKRCNFCSKVTVDDEPLACIPEDKRRHFEADLGHATATVPYLKGKDGTWHWVACDACRRMAMQNHKSGCRFQETEPA